MADQAERLREIVKESKTPGVTGKVTGPSRVIAVTSGKGGVGKTNIAVNLGIALSKIGEKVLLVDADLGLANVDVVLGIIPQYNLGHVILGERKIEDVIINGPLGLKIVASGSGIAKLANLSERGLEQCLGHLNEIEKFTDIMIIDTGAGLSRNVMKFVLAASEVIIVTTPEPTAITDAYGLIKVVASNAHNKPIWLLVNMVKNESEGNQVVDRLVTVAKKFIGIELEQIGFIPLDPVVSKAVKEQQPFFISHPRSAASLSINQIAEQLVKGETRRESFLMNKTTFFERLVEKFR